MVDYLTAEDEQIYGRELVNFAQRAAAHALEPALQNLENANAELRTRLAQEARHRLDQQVAAALPNFREIDRNPQWHRWLLGYDTLSGRVRQQLLNDAIASGSAERVLAFFRGYQREAGASPPASEGVPSGRARSTASGKPVYSRDQIKELYEQHRKGAFTGREAEWARQEVEIIRAGAEGRIQNPMDIFGK